MAEPLARPGARSTGNGRPLHAAITSRSARHIETRTIVHAATRGAASRTRDATIRARTPSRRGRYARTLVVRAPSRLGSTMSSLGGLRLIPAFLVRPVTTFNDILELEL